MVSAQRVNRWEHAIAQLQWPLFVTLTIPNSQDPESIKQLKKDWSKFRRRKLVRDKVKGGVAAFEITNKGNGWHPHIHAVCDSRWFSFDVPEPLRTDSAEMVKHKCSMAQKEVSSLWAEVIGEEASVVWIQRVKQKETVAREILKYCMKGDELIESPDPIAPMLRVLKSTRMLAGWGSLYPTPSPDEEDKPSVQCEDCGEEKTFLPADVVSFMTSLSDNRSFQPPSR